MTNAINIQETNTNGNELKKIESTLRELFFPKKLAVEICADCNLNCSMCHHDKMIRPKGNMPFELWKKCADEVALVSPDTECWFSFCGEPLLQPERLVKMISYGHSIGLRSLNINTNGMLLTPEWDDPILDSGVDLVVFGVDAFTKETYEKIRVKGDREVLYGNIERFLQKRDLRVNGPEVQVQFIEMMENSHELEPFMEYWLEQGATVKARNMLSWGGKFGTPLHVPKEQRIPCPWAITMMHVFWDGRVPRCPGDTEGDEGSGNAWDESLTVLWKRLGSYREKHLTHQFDTLPQRCQDCTDWMTGAAKRINPTVPV